MITSLISLMALTELVLPTQSDFVIPPTPIVQISALPQIKDQSIAPVITAKAVLTLDLNTGNILYQNNAEEKLPIASLTKLMTAFIILQENQLDQIVTISDLATKVEPSKINLTANEQITVENLIKSLIIKSANDSALALAIFNAENTEKFVEKMNLKVIELGLENTHFANPIGFDDPEQYSTAKDLAKLAILVYKNPLIKSTANIKNTTIYSTTGTAHELESTNDLLSSYLKVLGLKTGTTDLAGQCLISIVESPEGHQILNVILGSSSRFKESKILSQWVFDNYQWI